MAIDYTKSPDEILVQLINDENHRSFTAADLDLTNIAIAPDPIQDRLPFNNTRTSIAVGAASNSGYEGGVTVRYNRVPLRQVFPNTAADSVRYPVSSESYPLGSHTTLTDILPDINAAHSINISPADVFDVPLPTFSGPPPYAPAFVRLEMRANHKVFIGGINLRITPNDWDLAGLQFTELNGLLYPIYAPEVPPVVIPQSFTDIDDQFTHFQYGGWNYPVAPTPPSEQALGSFAGVDTQFQSLGTTGGWNYQPQ